mgnify:CR=1 FL=1
MLKNRIIRVAMTLVIMPVLGTIGYMNIEGYGLIDGIYMSIITISTVGFEVLEPLSDAGKIFTVFYIISSLGAFFYGIGVLGEATLNGDFARYLKRRKEKKRLQGFSGHYIVCGAGRMGKNICVDLADKGLPFVVIEHDDERVEELQDDGYAVVCGDASHDETLRAAGIERAKCLAAVLSKDSDNVFVILSARLLNPKLSIVSRATDDQAIVKLRKAGAHNVVSPYKTVAASMVAHMEQGVTA